MNIEEKRKIAFRIWIWGAQPIKFVRDYLQYCDSGMDELRLKSHYILLSYGFEMILKSRVAMLSTAQDKDALNTELQQLGHNFVKISDILQSELKNIGIAKKVELKIDTCNDPKNPEDKYRYFVFETMDGKEIRIEDFTDIRYGCMGGGVRIVDGAEHKKIVEYAVAMLKIGDKIYDEITKTTNALHPPFKNS